MKTFFKFFFVGLIFNGPPEIINQVYIHHSVAAFWATLRVYAIFLFVIFFLRKGYRRIVSNSPTSIVIWYILFGIFGLAIEWGLLGNAGVAWYGQIAMFTFWGTFGLMPVIFTEAPTFPDVIKSILTFALFWIPIYLIVGAKNSGLGLLIWIFGTIFLNYFYLKYFRRLKAAVP